MMYGHIDSLEIFILTMSRLLFYLWNYEWICNM